jgi:hypothetical protein
MPLGVLCVLAFDRTPGAVVLGAGALAGGTLLVLCASLATRLGDADLGRGWHLAAGATWALAALPALGGLLLGVGPGAPWLLLLCATAAAAGILRGARRRGPAPGSAHWLAAAALVVLATGVAVVVLGVVTAAFIPAIPPPGDQRAAAIYDADARVITQALPRCHPRVARSRVLLDRGAHPRLGAGNNVWFDADAGNGTRQVHRLELDTAQVTCWTCDEPGNNMRPAPQLSGQGLVFDTDRHVSPAEPVNTELYLTTVGGSPRPARRISFHAGPDDHALLTESGVVVWSRGWGGGYDVVSASLRSGHGSRFLGTPGRLFRGGTRWAIPLGWSVDLRQLVVADGHPLRPLRVTLVDPATNAPEVLPERAPPGSSASFVADGGWMLIAATERAGAASLIPTSLGFLLPRLVPGLADAGRFRTTSVRMGEPGGEGERIELGAIGDWGHPTGIACGSTGDHFVLGQRRPTDSGTEERLVEVELDCSR